MLLHVPLHRSARWLAAATLALAAAGPAFAVNIRPLNDRVVVEPLAEEQTKSGIIIPDTAKARPTQGIVVEVGPGRRDGGTRVPLDVQPGDRVLFGGYAGSEVRVEGEAYLILREDDILAVVED
jgi:chaperonin GroES